MLSAPVSAGWEEEELGAYLQTGELEEAGSDAGLDRFGDIFNGFQADKALNEIVQSALRACLTEDGAERVACSMGIVILCGLIRSTFSLSTGALDALTLCAACGITALLFGGTDALTALSIETLGKAQDTANVLLPTLAGAAALSGSVTAATVKFGIAGFAMNVLLNLCVNAVMPLTKVFCAAAAVEAVCESDLLTGVMRFLKWCVNMLLILLLSAFTIYLSVSGLVSGTTDAAVLRGAKTTISTMLPLVGSIASDAAASVLAAASVFRQQLGVFGLVLLASVLLLPFLRVGAQYLLMKGAAAVSGGLGEKRLNRLLDRCAEAMGMLLACLGACAMLLYFSVFSLMKVST